MSEGQPPPVRLDVANERAWCGERVLELTPKTFAILRHLVEHPDRLLTKDDLLAAVWGDTVVSEAALTSCIRDVRRALGDSSRTPRYIETVHRRGFRFIGPVAAARRTPPAANGDAPARDASGTSPMVGRDAELGRLRELFVTAAAGRRRVVFVTGEAGIGKTTLVDAFVAEVSGGDGVRIGRGQCVEHYGTGEPFLPVLEALTRLARGPGGDDVVRALRRYAPSWLSQLPALTASGDESLGDRAVQGVTPDRSLRELAEALEAIGADAPLVLVLEDLHWSDAATVDLLAVLARRRDPAKLLVVGTHRPAETVAGAHPLHPLTQELHAHGDCAAVALDFLDEPAVGDYVAGRLSAPECPPDLVRLLHRNTGGNPLFLATVVDDLIARGDVLAVDGRLTFSAPLDAVASAVPASLWQLIEKQIDRLEPEAQAVLAVASIAGAEFSSAVATADGIDALAAEACCAALARQGRFLRALGVAEWPDRTVAGRYGFIHTFHRTVLASRVSIAQRVGLHCRIGARLERAYGARAGEIAGELAMHFEAGRDFEHGLLYRVRAADNALRHHGHREAVQHAQHALELLRALPESPERLRQELHVQTMLGTALIARGWAAPEVAAALARAHELCKRLGLTVELFPILVGYFGYHVTRAELAVSRELAQELVDLASATDDTAVRLCAHNAAGMVAFYGGDFETTLAEAERGIAVYDPVEHHQDRAIVFRGQVVGGIVHAAWAHWACGAVDRAVARIREAVDVARRIAHPLTLAYACHFAAAFFAVLRDRDAAAVFGDEAIQLSQEHGFDLYASLAGLHRGWQRGDPDDMRNAVAAYEAMGARFGLPTHLALVVSAYEAAGRTTDALAVLEHAVATARETDAHYWDAELERLRGVLAPDPRDAAACFERAIAIARRQRAASFELRATTSLARLRRDAGGGEGRTRLAAVLAKFTEGFATADLREATALAVALGSPMPPAGRSPRTQRRPA
jgi:DNA-binding winged helix-turn-helix (wHTH) protein/predicted ATPase